MTERVDREAVEPFKKGDFDNLRLPHLKRMLALERNERIALLAERDALLAERDRLRDENRKLKSSIAFISGYAAEACGILRALAPEDGKRLFWAIRDVLKKLEDFYALKGDQT